MEPEQKCSPAELLLKVILAGTLSHYETRGMIDDKQLEQMLAAGKKIVSKTRNEMDTRYVLFLRDYCYKGIFSNCVLKTELSSFTRHLARPY